MRATVSKKLEPGEIIATLAELCATNRADRDYWYGEAVRREARIKELEEQVAYEQGRAQALETRARNAGVSYAQLLQTLRDANLEPRR